MQWLFVSIQLGIKTLRGYLKAGCWNEKWQWWVYKCSNEKIGELSKTRKMEPQKASWISRNQKPRLCNIMGDCDVQLGRNIYHYCGRIIEKEADIWSFLIDPAMKHKFLPVFLSQRNWKLRYCWHFHLRIMEKWRKLL